METYQDNCRLCLGSENVVEELFDSKDKEITYTEQVSLAFNLKITNVPSWPTKICSSCITALSEVMRLRETIESCQAHLATVFSNMYAQTDPEVIIEEGDSQVQEQTVKKEEIVETSQELESILEYCSDSSYSNEEDGEEEEDDEDDEDAAYAPSPAQRKKPTSHEKTKVGKPCEICNEVLFSRYLYLKHMNTQHPGAIQEALDSPHICESCGKEFPSKRNLSSHMKTHRMEEKFKCEICGKSFHNLKRHMENMHATQKPKQLCPICGLAFERLGRHIRRRHEGVKSYKCTVCEKQFHAKNGLQRHMNVHTGEKAPCLFCPHLATHMDNARAHMKKKHPEEYEHYLTQKRLAAQNGRRKEDQVGMVVV